MATPSPGLDFEPEPSIDLDSPEYYINRELSLLEFQHRVLEEARDERNPLLERAKFLAIVSSNLAILIRDKEGVEHFSRLKVPGTLPQLVPLKRSSGSARKDRTIPHDHHFVWLDQVITANLADLFPGMEIVEAHPFHVTRNADMVIQELEADHLLETIEESVRQRRFGSVVRVTVNQTMPPRMLEILMNNLEVDSKDI